MKEIRFSLFYNPGILSLIATHNASPDSTTSDSKKVHKSVNLNPERQASYYWPKFSAKVTQCNGTKELTSEDRRTLKFIYGTLTALSSAHQSRIHCHVAFGEESKDDQRSLLPNVSVQILIFVRLEL